MRIADLSSWNGIVDFRLARQARRDLVGIYQRTQEWRQAGTGIDEHGQSRHADGGLLDRTAYSNLHGARGQGLLTGVYHRAYPSLNSPEQEAIEFTQRIRLFEAYQPGNLYPMIDVEEPRDLNTWIDDFFEAYQDLSPVKALMFYASNSYFKQYYRIAAGRSPVLRDDFRYKICVAHTEKYSTPAGLPAEQWAGKVPLTNFLDKRLPALHQYTHSATTNGIPAPSGGHDLMCLLHGVRMKDVII